MALIAYITTQEREQCGGILTRLDQAAVAGQGNHSASLYHFKDKHNLINCLLERHSDAIRDAWIATLEHNRAHGRDSLEEVVEVMVRPLSGLQALGEEMGKRLAPYLAAFKGATPAA